ncbi:hypothetical protein B4135_1138 [Caldibacillus debilis]|uniref:Uncharacterized protein n=1 Tax=Caldibacillus debilis TaxID=301148 RepID=A0A150MEE1_9BACI|nr:hypothetical protein B4135_1138 [Caldibacillus debilis]
MERIASLAFPAHGFSRFANMISRNHSFHFTKFYEYNRIRLILS